MDGSRGKTLVCVPIMVGDAHQALKSAARAKELGADIVEYRVDEVFEGAGDLEGARVCEQLCEGSPLPCIVTCRSSSEGGSYDGDDTDRVSLYEKLGTGEHPPRYLDIELSAYTRSMNLRQKVDLAVVHGKQLREMTTGLILSMHDFEARPADLTRRLLSMREQRAAAVHKVAYRANTLRDNLELFEILRERDLPTIALGMGEAGLMSRVLAPKFGGFLTFASLDESSGTAPGQPTIEQLLDVYRFRSIGHETKVYGVIGSPVAHSIGPDVHNEVFGELGIDGVYLPLPVPTIEHEGHVDEQASDIAFKATVLALLEDPHLDLGGASVTIPHKERLVRLAGAEGWRIDPLVSACGAANTITRDDRGGIEIRNTDAEAMRGILRSSASESVGIVGAGGVARAAAIAALELGRRVVIAARNHEKAGSLAEDLRVVFGDSCDVSACGIDDDASLAAVEVLVNATPVGMLGGPAEEASPIASGVLETIARAGGTVIDTVYAPLRTPLIREASELGCNIVTGDVLFIEQAALQQQSWFGLRSIEDVRRIISAKAASLLSLNT